MTLSAVIDLGSNSVRLVVYEVDPKIKHKHVDKRTTPLNKCFKALFDHKKVAGLAAYVKDGVFANDGIAKATEVLQDLSTTAKNLNCDKIHVFATAVLRNCSNSEAAISKIEKATDLKIDLLSEEEEAHLGFVGATCDRTIESGTLIDIGGGSTEFTRIKDDADSDNISLPQGCVSSYANYVKLILPTVDEAQQIQSSFSGLLDGIQNVDAYRNDEMFGIGGSVRALDKLYAQMFSNETRLHTLETYQIDALISMLEKDPSMTAHSITKSTPDRVHTVMPGIIIIRTAMERFGCMSLTVCKYGIREGYLLERVLHI